MMAKAITTLRNVTPKKTKAKKTHPRGVGEHDVSLGKRLRIRRVELGMSQDDLGTHLGVSFQQVQKYEKGVNRISTGRLQQIAKALDVPLTFFYDKVNPADEEVQSLLFLDSTFTLRLLRAYHAVKDQAVQRQFVSLMESFAASEA